MKTIPKLIVGLAGAALLSMPLWAGPTEPPRPMFEAVRSSTPVGRARVLDHLRESYPQLGEQVRTRLQQSYPNLEKNVAEALLETWEEHPMLLSTLAREIRAKHGEEIAQARQDLLSALEQNYPDFRSRMETLLTENGPLPAAFSNFRDGREARRRAGWRGNSKALTAEGPERARKLYERMLARDPDLFAKLTTRLLQARQPLREAISNEFPGIQNVVRQTMQAKHPRLLNRLLATSEALTESARDDLRMRLEAKMPGFAEEVRSALTQSAPDLRRDLSPLWKDS